MFIFHVNLKIRTPDIWSIKIYTEYERKWIKVSNFPFFVVFASIESLAFVIFKNTFYNIYPFTPEINICKIRQMLNTILKTKKADFDWKIRFSDNFDENCTTKFFQNIYPIQFGIFLCGYSDFNIRKVVSNQIVIFIRYSYEL